MRPSKPRRTSTVRRGSLYAGSFIATRAAAPALTGASPGTAVLIGHSLFVCDRRMVSANQGTAFKAPEISTPDRHPERRPSPLQVTGSTPCLRHYASEITYKIKITSRPFALLARPAAKQ
jgi:hypothetical protein